MYNLTMLALTSLAAAVASTAYAGRDVGQIDQQEKANRAATEQRSADARTQSTARRLILPLDHGPHAQTTPWLNKQRLLRAEGVENDAASRTFPR